MRHRAATIVTLVGLTLGLTLGASTSFADGKKKAASDDDKYDPENHTHISKFMEKVVEANAKFVSRDFPGAIEMYRAAIQLQPTNPLGHYMLGEAQSASGNLAEAQASWEQADNVGDKVPSVKVKVLFCLADLKERQKKWEDAKTAWLHYKQFIADHAGSGGVVATADARIQVIDDAAKQDKAYEIVRTRIAQEVKDAAAKK